MNRAEADGKAADITYQLIQAYLEADGRDDDNEQKPVWAALKRLQNQLDKKVNKAHKANKG